MAADVETAVRRNGYSSVSVLTPSPGGYHLTTNSFASRFALYNLHIYIYIYIQLVTRVYIRKITLSE
jgi:hypothetical protein